MLTSSYSHCSSTLSHTESFNAIDVLQQCLDLVQDAKTIALATQSYQQLRDRLCLDGADAQMLQLLDLLWEANLSSQRAAAMWQHMCHTEQQLTDQMAESHVQLHQNYLRLMQEQ